MGDTIPVDVSTAGCFFWSCTPFLKGALKAETTSGLIQDSAETKPHGEQKQHGCFMENLYTHIAPPPPPTPEKIAHLGEDPPYRVPSVDFAIFHLRMKHPCWIPPHSTTYKLSAYGVCRFQGSDPAKGGFPVSPQKGVNQRQKQVCRPF